MTSRESSKVTSSTIAHLLGVSQATVSYVLSGQARKRRISEETTERVLEAARRLNYVPNRVARSLRLQRTAIIGVLFGDLKSDWPDRVMFGLRSVLAAKEYTPLFAAHHFNPEWEQHDLENLLQRNFEAILCVPMASSIETYRRILQHGVPLVFLGDTLENMPEASFVAWDVEAAVRYEIGLLIKDGRRRIALVGGDAERKMHRARRTAFIDAIREAGLPLKDEWIAWVPGGGDIEGAVEGMFKDGAETPDAIFNAFDATVPRCQATLERLGVSDDAVAVSGMDGWAVPRGIDDNPLRLRAPAEEIGRAAAQIAMELIEDPGKAPLSRLVKSENQSRPD